jgi:uncharacterized membrane protein
VVFRGKKERTGPRFLSNWRTDVRNYLLAGLLVTVPLGTTLLVMKWVLGLADRFANWLPATYQPETYLGFEIPGLFGIILFFLFLLIIGFLVRNFLGQKLVRLTEKVIEHIPFVRTIYAATKQLTTAIFASGDGQFSRVVLIEYPRRGLRSLAFVTKDPATHMSSYFGEPSVSVFVPTTPNPTSGFYLLVPMDQLVETDLSIEEAFRVIMSAGISVPERIAASSAARRRQPE